MPIETKTVMICGECGADKAESNGWFVVFINAKAVTVRPAQPKEVVDNLKDADAACGRGCAIKMMSKGLAELKHGTVQGSGWKRNR